MPHRVRAEFDTNLVKHKDLRITVEGTDGKLGTLLVSKGNIEWLPRGHSVNKRRMSWTRFAKVMESEGRPVKVKRSS